MTEGVEIRTYGDASLPTLVYLPGLHGDWTLIGRFRRAVEGKVHFVEMNYPRTLNWSLREYGRAIATALKQTGITEGWLLGESFGSQIVWALLQEGSFHTQGIILAGGFVRHPVNLGVRWAEKITGGISMRLLTRMLFGYARLSRLRHLHSPEILQEITDFMARRTDEDRRAAKHRLHLLATTDFCMVASASKIPIYAITGAFDPIVPWFFVRRWLLRNCKALKAFRIIWPADHNVLRTGCRQSSEQILRWIGA
jgi:pimeloyl-ACP methyl ester carboxylesterase